jgi:hypothetical protein
MEEVATMEIYTMNSLSLPLTRACAPSALTPAPAAPVVVPAVEWAPISAQAEVRPVAVMAAERAPVSRVHQVQVQAELAQALTLANGITGTNSTTGFNTKVSQKRYADGGSGVPPRGRPV